MTPEERQRARERAADGIAPREQVVIRPGGWPSPVIPSPLHGLTPTEKRRWYRQRARAQVAS